MFAQFDLIKLEYIYTLQSCPYKNITYSTTSASSAFLDHLFNFFKFNITLA